MSHPTLFLVRHGATRLSGSFCGSTNPPLSMRGRTHALSAARRLAPFPIDVCYTSPQLRARQTASILRSRLGVPLVTHPALKELHFGEWESRRFKDIEKKWPLLA